MSTGGKRRTNIPWVRILLLLLATAGIYVYVSRMNAKPAIAYETMPVAKGNVTSHVTATGTVQARTQIEVGSQVSGIVKTLYVNYNSTVKKGQPLAQLDPSTFQAQVDQQQATVDGAQANMHQQEANEANMLANIRSAEATTVSSEAAVETARATLANAQGSLVAARANVQKGLADLKNAQLGFDRNKVLKQKELVAASDLDTARTAYLDADATLSSLRAQQDAAQATYRSAQAGVRAAQANLEANRMKQEAAVQQAKSAAQQIKAAQAQVVQAQANLKQAKLTLSECTIRSPMTGLVLDRKVTLGQTVAAQFQAPDLFTLAENLEDMQVWTSVDEADIGDIKIGARATFTVDSYPDDHFRGKVAQIRQAPVTVQGVVTYTVVIDTKNPEHKLEPGMTATVAIHVDTRREALLIPNQALRFRPSQLVRPTPTPHTPTPGESPSASGTPGRHHRGDKDRGDWGGQHNHEGHGQGGEGRRPGAGGGGVRTQTLYTVDPTDSSKLVAHKIVPGITDGVNTEMVKGDLKENDEVVTDSNEESAKGGAAKAPGGGQKGGRGGGMRFF